MLEGQEEFVSNGYKEMWAKTSEKKEKSGKCFSKMKVKTESKEGSYYLLCQFLLHDTAVASVATAKMSGIGRFRYAKFFPYLDIVQILNIYVSSRLPN